MENSRLTELRFKQVLELDQQLRKLIADYYMSLKEINDSEKAVKLLAEHITIMVEMLNDFKS